MTEFFANGLPKSQIEYDRTKRCVTSKKLWFINAELQSELELLSADENRYHEKVYYPNGQIKEEGDLLYSSENKAFIKTGIWLTYANDGKKKGSEKFKFSLGSN
jgi:antitoxin component YwqK of YwqJK toxin-antitoxin module